MAKTVSIKSHYVNSQDELISYTATATYDVLDLNKTKIEVAILNTKKAKKLEAVIKHRKGQSLRVKVIGAYKVHNIILFIGLNEILGELIRDIHYHYGYNLIIDDVYGELPYTEKQKHGNGRFALFHLTPNVCKWHNFHKFKVYDSNNVYKDYSSYKKNCKHTAYFSYELSLGTVLTKRKDWLF